MRLRAEVILGGLVLASCAAGPSERPVAETPRRAYRAPAAEMLRTGPAYSVGGRTYRPYDDRRLDEVGMASWYGQELAGRPTASGEAFDPAAITVAHRTLPLGSYVEVTALDTGATIVARVNDRGPFHGDRLIDLSLGAARQLGLTGAGARPIRVRRVEPSQDEARALRSGQAVPLRRGPDRDTLGELRERVGWSAPPPRVTRPPPGAGALYVQIATFSSEDRARSLGRTLDADVVGVGGLYRVRMGPFDHAADAQAALASLAARGYPDATLTR